MNLKWEIVNGEDEDFFQLSVMKLKQMYSQLPKRAKRNIMMSASFNFNSVCIEMHSIIQEN